MDFSIPDDIFKAQQDFKAFLSKHMIPDLAGWYSEGRVPRDLFTALGQGQWLGFDHDNGSVREQSALKQAVTVLVHISLGTLGLHLFATRRQREELLEAAAKGNILVCVGNTEPTAGSDVAGIATRAERVAGGWKLNGTKGYATNGALSDYAIITAVSHPEARRNNRLSMFIVDLSAEGVSRSKLNKRVWVPSDLTRLRLKDVFVPAENLLGGEGRGLQQVLEIFTHSRLTISALTLGTAVGAFDLGVDHGRKREIFGRKVLDFQAKSFEAADFYSKIEAARLMLWKACWTKDQGRDFKLEASMAKYLTVEVARAVSAWAADLFGAASVVWDHPIHKFPMDAWASSLGEGTQDVQKLIIFRELVRRLTL